MAAAVVAAAAALPACASDPPPLVTRQPYKVVLLPVEGAARALALNEKRGEDFVPLALTPEEMAQTIFERIRDSNAFSELVAAPAGLSAGAYGDDLGAAADFARRENADLILRVTVKSAEMRDLGNNSNTFWSTFAWFMLPLPTWFSDDRTYDTDLSVEAALYEPRDTQKPTASVVASSGQQSLDLWDRGLSPWVPIVPPPFLKGRPSVVSETLTKAAMDRLIVSLVDELQKREIPSRFDVALSPETDGLRIRIVSRRALRSIEVFVAGKRAESWAETAIQPDAGSTADGFVYTRTAVSAARAAAGTELRVVAEDEAGAREVRTIVLGRSQ
jgi:hypothetical protein